MTDKNRFSNLMGGLGSDSKPEATEDKPAARTTPKKKGQANSSGSAVAKHRSEDFAQVGMYLPKELHRKIKIASAMTGNEMSVIAAEAIEAWLTKNLPTIE